ncbi:MAG: glycerophosphodiester phosphodiesterase [Calditrichaeota bacterium]|nr:MAG: glycerophosphodiester phosphodiesterase [Calditrichota bacterium]
MQPIDKVFEKGTLNFAHRGFTAEAPENSLAAFKAAMDLGVDGIEFDVRTCRSGELVVFHDPTLSRMTNGRGFVKNKTLEELKQLRLKNKRDLTVETIPTLEEVLDLVQGKLILNVEIKNKGLPKDHIEQKVVDVLQRYGLKYKTILSSFNPIVIRRLKKIDPNLITGLLLDKNFTVRLSEIPLSRFSGAKAIHLEQSLARPRILRKIQNLGFYCVVWNVNDAQEMERLIQTGVQVIITDKPDLLKKVQSRLLQYV